MIHIRVILVLLAAGFLLSGCNHSNQGTLTDGSYPPEVVGIWKATDQPWIIKIEPDGSISKLNHEVVGPIKVSEGGADWGQGDEGSFAVFVLGKCQTEFKPSGRILKATVILDSYHIKVPQGELQGRIEDYFSGPVSKDGETWTAEWRQYGYLEGAEKPNRDYIDAHPEKIVFQKVNADYFKTIEKPAEEKK